MLSFKPTFSLSSFIFIKRLFIYSLLSVIRVVSSAYLRLLTFIPEIFFPACASSSPAFLMMYSAYKLNKQGDNIQPWHTPFPIWNQSVVLCPVLISASWTAYIFFKRHEIPEKWSGIPIFSRIFHSLLWSTVKDFGTVNKAEIDIFFWNSLAFLMIQWILAIWSLVRLPFLNLDWKKDSILKSSNITLPTKVHIVKVIIFPAVMYIYEIWTIKKAERWRTDAFEFWCWIRLLKIPWTSRRANQSILKEINPEMERLMLKLKLQYFGYLMQKANSFEKTLMLGKIEGRSRREWQRMRWLENVSNLVDMHLSILWKIMKDKKHGVLQFIGSQSVWHDLAIKPHQQLYKKTFAAITRRAKDAQA